MPDHFIRIYEINMCFFLKGIVLPMVSVRERCLGIRVRVQRWWKVEHGVHATQNAAKNKNCHQNLIITNYVMDERRSG
jgi:hypothetical protein